MEVGPKCIHRPRKICCFLVNVAILAYSKAWLLGFFVPFYAPEPFAEKTDKGENKQGGDRREISVCDTGGEQGDDRAIALLALSRGRGFSEEQKSSTAVQQEGAAVAEGRESTVSTVDTVDASLKKRETPPPIYKTFPDRQEKKRKKRPCRTPVSTPPPQSRRVLSAANICLHLGLFCRRDTSGS